MSTNRTLPWRVGVWGLRALIVLLALFLLQVILLAFPQAVFGNHLRSGTVVVYFDGQPPDRIALLAAEVETRLHGSGYYDASSTNRVFLFASQPKYSFFARLALVSPRAQGFSLSALGNAYVSSPNIAALARITNGRPRFSVWEGDPAHTAAHEIAHNLVADRIGRGVWAELPFWKQEGLPEYIANITHIRSDPTATLSRRIDILADDREWGAKRRWDRQHYEAALLVEYLFDVRGLTLGELVADSVVRDDTHAAMIRWQADQRVFVHNRQPPP